MDIQQVERMRHLWKDARSKYVSFFTCLSEVRREIGDDALEEWCRKELLIGLTAINKAVGLLQDIDAARTKTELSTVAQVARDKRELELHAKKLARIERENEISAKKLKNAERQAAEESRVIAQKAAERRERRRQIAAVEGDGIQRARRWWEKNPYATHRECEKATGVGHGHSVSARRALVDQCVIPKQREAALAAYDSLTDEAKFERCVKEGIQAVNHQWVLGDLAIKVSALKSYGANVLERFSTRIDVEYQTLKRYRSVAQLWPEKGIRIPFSVAMILSTHPDRFTIASKDPGMSCENARRIMRAYKGPTNVIPIRAAR